MISKICSPACQRPRLPRFSSSRRELGPRPPPNNIRSTAPLETFGLHEKSNPGSRLRSLVVDTVSLAGYHLSYPRDRVHVRHQCGVDGVNEQFEASCLCGGIRLTYSGQLGPSNYCHCEDCRRANGSAFNIGVRVDRKDLEVKATTELRSYRYVSGSGKEIERCFCGICGSPIFTLHPDRPEYAWVKAGIINQPGVINPTYENWTKDKVKWAIINVSESHDESKRA